MRVSVLTAEYPTEEENSRGRPIWNTLDRFHGLCDLTVNCSRACPPAALRRLLQPRSYLRYAGQVNTTLNPRIPARPIEYRYLPGVTRSLNGVLLSRVYRRRVLEEKPDVLLAYPIYPDGYAAVRTGRKLGIPTIIGSRGSDLKLLPPRGRIREQVIWALHNADAVLCVSDDLVRIVRELGGRSVHLVRNGVDSSVFVPVPRDEARRALSLPREERWILFTGRLSPVKGLPYLLQALAQLRRGGESWKLALIGDGPQRADLTALAENLGITSEVRFVSPLPPPGVAQWMNAADVFCLPSESEGMPNVVLEALACGRNVVATNVGGTPELIDDTNGILVERRDSAALAAALQAAGARSWDRDHIAKSAFWPWEKVAGLTLDICRDACGAPSAHRLRA